MRQAPHQLLVLDADPSLSDEDLSLKSSSRRAVGVQGVLRYSDGAPPYSMTLTLRVVEAPGPHQH